MVAENVKLFLKEPLGRVTMSAKGAALETIWIRID
jgi:hypothetical protein